MVGENAAGQARRRRLANQVVGEADGPAGPVARRALPPLVELAVVGEVRLRHHPEEPSPVQDDRRVVDAAGVAERGADGEDGPERLRGGEQLPHGALDAVAGQRPRPGRGVGAVPARRADPAPARILPLATMAMD